MEGSFSYFSNSIDTSNFHLNRVRVAMCQELPAFFASHGGGDKIIDELSELLRDEESEVVSPSSMLLPLVS